MWGAVAGRKTFKVGANEQTERPLQMKGFKIYFEQLVLMSPQSLSILIFTQKLGTKRWGKAFYCSSAPDDRAKLLFISIFLQEVLLYTEKQEVTGS